MKVSELEPGEITDDSNCGIDLYKPLKRPKHGRIEQHDPIPETDSDDDFPGGKRVRMTTGSSQIPKKYTVWTPNVNDDISDILTSFGMDSPENDRNVENYPIPEEHIQKKKQQEENKRKIAKKRMRRKRPKDSLSATFPVPIDAQDIAVNNSDTIKEYSHKRNKRKYRKNNIPRGGVRRKIPKGNPLAPIPVPIHIEDITVSDTDTIEEVAKCISDKLSEPNLELVLRIVLILGKMAAVEYFKKTREIQSKGGLLIQNGSRRRTSGGVFIHLIRTDKKITASQLAEIFEDPKIVSARKCEVKMRRRKKRAQTRKELRNPPPSPETLDLPPLPERSEILSLSKESFIPNVIN